jgi:hypothetical protein
MEIIFKMAYENFKAISRLALEKASVSRNI